MLLQEIIYPFQRLVQSWGNEAHSVWLHYLKLNQAARENERLKNRVSELEARMLDYDHQQSEVNRLRGLLGFTQQYKKDLVLAEVVSQNTNRLFPSLRISKGALNTINLGMPVISTTGVVGRIFRVGRAFADVQIITDHNSYIDVLLERSRVRGVLRGIGDGKCRLMLHRKSDVRIGDTLITTGAVGAFPKGLPVGRVARIQFDSDNVSQLVTVQPFVETNSLDEVMILPFFDGYMERLKEIAGEAWIMDLMGTKNNEVGHGL